MKQIKDTRRRYEGISIPAELSGRAKVAIIQSGEERKSQRQGIPTVRIRREHRIWGTYADMVAALVLVFTAALNTNTAFVEMAAGLSVIGAAAWTLTFRSYERDEGDWKVSVEIPSVEMIAKDTDGLDSALNREIYDLCGQYADEVMRHAREHKKAFMETGGTGEEWEAHDTNVHAGYKAEAQIGAYLLFAVQGAKNWSSAYSETRYYNIDLKDSKMVTLADILGHDYARIAGEGIPRQVENVEEKEDIAFWPKSEGGLTGVAGKTAFHMNEEENPVIVSDKYGIASGAYGKLEFEIGKTGDMAEKTGCTGDSMVPEEETAAFAGRVREAVTDRDMDALVFLTFYPSYVEFKDGDVSAGLPEELAVLGTDRIFTSELTAAVEVAGDEMLSPNMTGFVLKKDGAPNVVFGISEGVLTAKGISY